jgi:hypothetical protein
MSVSATLAPLLTPEVVEQARQIGKAIRQGQVAPLVGAGLSVDSGMPTWGHLVRRLVLAWQKWDSSPVARTLHEEDYFGLIEATIGSQLAVVAYLRGQVPASPKGSQPSFGDLLFPALYLDATTQSYVDLKPRHTHRQLVALFKDHPRRIWTTNYDDLLEEAAREAAVKTKSLDSANRSEGRDFAVAHLHGYLPPSRSSRKAPNPRTAAIVLAEDDYHAIAADVIGWTNREFLRLFDGFRVLILGMSLEDPNLRRVLQVTSPQTSRSGTANRSSRPKHFAVMLSMSMKDLPPSGSYGQADVDAACSWRAWYWQKHGVELVELPTYDSILPFLMRLRYESFGKQPGDLWKEAANWCQGIEPWGAMRQGYARDQLTDIIRDLRADFSVADPDEVREVGIFLLKPDARTLELAFRGGCSERSFQGGREFSVDPDSPTGVAGRVYVSSDVVRIHRNDGLYDYGMSMADASTASEVKGIIAVPIVDWEADGLPLGVIYLTTTTVTGRLFSLPETQTAELNARSLDDLYVWLQRWGLQLLKTMHTS